LKKKLVNLYCILASRRRTPQRFCCKCLPTHHTIIIITAGW